MAALEKIRSKSVMLLIVIGVALLAFIIGDFLNSGRSFFGAGTTVAVVDGTKISIQDFQKRYEEASERMQQSQQKMDAAVMQNYVLQGMVEEQLLAEELEALSIGVTNAELTEAMTGKRAMPQMVQFANQMGVETPAQLYDMIFNPSNHGLSAEQVQPLRNQWLQMEEETARSLRYQKLSFLLGGALQANDLDKAAIASEMTNASTVNIAYLPYSSLEDKDYAVTDADVKACYEEQKSFMKVEDPIRRIKYIAVDIIPSAADKEAATKLVARADSLLKTENGVDAVRNTLSDFAVETNWVLASNLDQDLKNFVTTSEIGAVSADKMIGDVHSMTKLLAKKTDIDSIQVNMLQVNGPKAVQDSILNLLNSGKAFAEVADNKVAGGQENVWMNMMGMGSDDKSVEAKAKILNAGSEYFVLDQTDNAALIYKVNQKVAPKPMYQIAQVSLTVYPSDETIDNLRDGLQTYIAKNNTGKAFVDNAVAAGYQPVLAEITEETPQVNRIENTRKLVQWAFGASVGEVSSIFDKEDNNKMIAATLEGIVDEGYMPMNDASVRPLLEAKARNSKKGDAMIAKYQGKASDLNGYASLMKVPVDTAVVVSFSQDFVPAVRGVEPALTAKAPYAKAGELVGPTKGEQGVYVYQVVKNDKSSSQFTPEQAAERYSMMFGANSVSQHLMEILKSNKDIENKLINFY